jgi:hypothetical protein
VFITAGPITKLFAGGGGGEWTTCAMIDDEPITKLFAGCVCFCFICFSKLVNSYFSVVLSVSP